MQQPSEGAAPFERVWIWTLVVGVPALLGPQLATGATRAVLHCIFAAVTLALIVVGARRQEGRPRRIWSLFAAGNAALLVGDVVWNIDYQSSGPSFPSIADAFYLLAYPLLGAGVFAITRPFSRRRLRANVLDSLILGIQGFVILWVLVIERYFEAFNPSVIQKVVATTYLVAALVVGALAAGILMFVRERTASHWFLFAAFITLLPTDIAQHFPWAAGTDALLPVTGLAWRASFLLFAVAALHPSVGRVAGSARPYITRLSWKRVAFYGAAGLTVPVGFAVGYGLRDHIDWILVLGTAAALWTALLARLHDAIDALSRAIDERDRLTDTLKRSEARWESVVTNSTDMIAFLDEDTTVTWVSPVVADLLGYAPAEVTGLDIFSFVHPDDIDVAAQAYVDAVMRMEPRSVEVRLRHKDERWRWIELRGASLLHDPNVQSIVLAGRDATKRREAQDALRSSEERFRELAETISQIFYIMSAQGEFIYISPAYEQIWGMSMESLYKDPTSWERCLHPEDRDRVVNAFGDGGFPEPIEYRIVLGDETRWIREQTFAIRDQEGAIVRILGVADDITERKLVEQALVEREQFERAILDSLSAHVAVVDRAGTIIAVNEAWSEVAHIVQQENQPATIGSNLVAALRAALEDEASYERAMVLEGLEAILSGARDDFSIEYAVQVESEEHWYSMHVSPLRTATGGAVLTHLDISESKRARREQERLTEQLRQSQKLEAIGRLAGGVAHDFNNILAVIQNYAWFLKEEIEPNDPKVQDVDEIITAGDRAAKLVQQLLTFSRKEIVKPEILDINSVISDYGKFLRTAIGEDLVLDMNLVAGAAPVLLDSGHVGQILTNLAVNARDAMPAGGRLVIETENVTVTKVVDPVCDPQPGDYVILRVSDTGHGMSEEVVAHVFEPFFTTKRRGEGTGLGLSTVYGIVNQAGGHIHIDSAPGKGTSFTIYLPTISRLVEDEEEGASEVADAQGSETVLLVEDEEAVRRMVERILVRHGYRVLPTPSGEIALRIARQQEGQIDLLLTDVVMPNMSGKTLADEMSVIRPDTKVVFMSGYTDEIIARRGRVAEDEVLIEKPFTANELLEVVRRVLDRRAPV